MLRVWLRSGGPRLTDRLAAGFRCSAGLAVGWSTGPGWLVPVSWVLIGLTLLTHLTALVELFAPRYVGPARRVDPQEFRLRLLAVCRQEAVPGLAIGVGPDPSASWSGGWRRPGSGGTATSSPGAVPSASWRSW